MYGAPRPQTPWQSLPLAAGAQHVEDRIQGLAVVHAGSPAFGLQLGFRQHFLEVRPQGVRRPPVGIHRGIVFLSHDTYLQHRTRYSDRLLAEAQAGHRAVLFVDAAHFVFAPFLGILWCVQRLFVKAPSGRQRVNVLAALHATSHELFTVTNLTYITATTVCELVQRLAGAYPGLP